MHTLGLPARARIGQRLAAIDGILIAAARVGGVDYVNDSKASNPHAAAAALASYRSVVWIAGGLFRGSDGDADGLSAPESPPPG